MITAVQWCGLCAATETNRPAEMDLIIWTIRNRVESGRSMFGLTPTAKAENRHFEAVVLYRNAFSAFNGQHGTPGEIYETVRRDPRYSTLVPAAEACASYVLACSLEGAPFSSRTFYYWSPQSMDPKGSLPKWDWKQLRRFVPRTNIDPWRFCFAEERRSS